VVALRQYVPSCQITTLFLQLSSRISHASARMSHFSHVCPIHVPLCQRRSARPLHRRRHWRCDRRVILSAGARQRRLGNPSRASPSPFSRCLHLSAVAVALMCTLPDTMSQPEVAGYSSEGGAIPSFIVTINPL
jgi:hypothetical protein